MLSTSKHLKIVNQYNITSPTFQSQMEKIEETFKHISDNWKEEYYQTCELEWENIISFISKEPTPYQCSNCNTFWMKYGFLENITYNICPNCDTHCQPFLCNPINYILS